MKFENEFTVDAPVDEAWALLTDIPTIAPCLPGAKLEGEEDGEYEGTVTVRVGPMTAKYKGTVRFEERDDEAHRAVLKASGRDARGQGTAEANIAAQLTEVDDGTKVSIDTELVISGKVAQFGKGVMVDVSEKMLGQFADCLGNKLLGEEEEEEAPAAETGDAAASGEAAQPTPAAATQPDPEPLDLMELAGDAVGKRAAVAAAVVAAVLLVIWLLRRGGDDD